MFKQTTGVVSHREELDNYIETIAKIIDSERIWNDPDMADFDTGEREDTGIKVQKKPKKLSQSEDGSKMENESDSRMEEHSTNGVSNESQVSEDNNEQTSSLVMTRSRTKPVCAV